jgi:hypothetical protein
MRILIMRAKLKSFVDKARLKSKFYLNFYNINLLLKQQKIKRIGCVK